MVGTLLEKISCEQMLNQFHFDGMPEEVQELRQLMKMVASTSYGRKVLLELKCIDGGLPAISFVSGMTEYNGRFYRQTNCIELVRIGTNIPEMSEEQKTKIKIQMAATLAHELQHRVDVTKNIELFNNVRNREELIAAQIFDEMSAYLTGEQVSKELRAQNDLLDKLYVYHHPEDKEGTFRVVKSPKDPMYIQYGGEVLRESVKVPSPRSRRKSIKDALSGKVPRINDYILKRWGVKDFNPNASHDIFRKNIESYLSYLQVPMTFDEVMAQVKTCRRPRRKRHLMHSLAQLFRRRQRGR